MLRGLWEPYHEKELCNLELDVASVPLTLVDDAVTQPEARLVQLSNPKLDPKGMQDNGLLVLCLEVCGQILFFSHFWGLGSPKRHERRGI